MSINIKVLPARTYYRHVTRMEEQLVGNWLIEMYMDKNTPEITTNRLLWAVTKLILPRLFKKIIGSHMDVNYNVIFT